MAAPPENSPAHAAPSRLSLLQLVAYGALGMPTYMVLMPLIVYLPPFYAEHLGVGLAAIGSVFFLARLCDGVADLVVGNLSDRSQARFGRRKIWILFGSPVLLGALLLLCNPPPALSVVQVGALMILLYVAWTCVQVPFLSWGADLSPDYNERTRIAGFREGGGMLGMLCATGLPFLVFGDRLELGGILQLFGTSILVLLPVTAAAALWLVPDRPGTREERVTLGTLLQATRRNGPFLRLVLAVLLLRTGASVFDATEVWILSQHLQMEGSFLGLIFGQYVASVLAIPLVLRLARRYGKHRTLCAGLVLALVYFAGLGLMPPGQPELVYAVFLVNAIGNAAAWVLPPAMVADTVDLAAVRGAPGQSGTYMAVFTLIFKVSLAAGVGIGLPLLELGGFDPRGSNGVAELTVLRLVGTGLPVLFVGSALALLWRYPLDERRQRVIRRLLDRPRTARAAGQGGGAAVAEGAVAPA
jgi:glycoside/pentoside/hexuronide:cation symporter, GPH family